MKSSSVISEHCSRDNPPNPLTGFTLVELLVVFAIMAIIAAVAAPGLKSGGQSLALDRAAHKFSQDARRAMEFSLRARPFVCAPGTVSGYGILARSATDTMRYRIFADCNGNRLYDGSDEDVQVIEFEKNIKISGVTPSPNAHVFFIPPNPDVEINPGNPSNAQVTLQLIDNPSRTRTITISDKGVIDVD